MEHTTLSLSGLQSRFGNKLLENLLVCPHNGTAVLKGSKPFFTVAKTSAGNDPSPVRTQRSFAVLLTINTCFSKDDVGCFFHPFSRYAPRNEAETAQNERWDPPRPRQTTTASVNLCGSFIPRINVLNTTTAVK